MSPRSPLLLLLAALPLVSGWSCPPWTSDPCNCFDYNVVCWGNGTDYPERKVGTALGMVSGDGPWHLTLRTMEMRQLPAAAASASSLTLIDCNIGELRKPVRMEWHNLGAAYFESIRTMHSPWSLVEGARHLSDLTVKGSSMTPTIGEDFRRQVPASVTRLTLKGTGTTTIEPGSMTHLKDLRMIDFSSMPIRFFPRSALPENLPRMTVLFLVDTLLDKLQPSFFDGMPNLQGVLLNGNKFTSLESSWFTPMTNTLKVFSMNRNPLLCSCDLLWMKQESKIIQSAFRLLSCYNSDQNLERVEDLNERDYC